MFIPEHLTACFVFALIFYGSPGPATLSLAANGAAVGFRRSLPYGAGIIAGVLVNFIVSMLGIAALMETAPAVVTVMKYASFAYIVYLAIRMARIEPDTRTARALRFHDGVVLNMLNPRRTSPRSPSSPSSEAGSCGSTSSSWSSWSVPRSSSTWPGATRAPRWVTR